MCYPESIRSFEYEGTLMNRKVCIHCHFYQPPRENPWLEDVELQDSAYPFHDWNERITDECYRQNAVSRILNGEGRIADIFNNYAKISFNFGPTLLSWMEKRSPEVYRRILEADRISQEYFNGHGAAIAQAYNHMIMPLSNPRDKQTQVVWGIEDFRHRFKRMPEGMWLPETAVDTPTLEVLAANGLRFTILAPHQAARVRPLNTDKWFDVDRETLDTRRAYLCRLPSGATINLFFYQGSVSQRIAYGNLIRSGDLMAHEILSHLDDDPEHSQLANIATDGETYGHHYRHGDMALAYCLNDIQANGKADITIYGQFLEETPPDYEVQIHENTSWSCSHGVERWKSNCGCHTDPAFSGKQQWRTGLRNALDWIRDQLEPLYEQNASIYMADPWAARDRYIQVIFDRSPEKAQAFLCECMDRSASDEERIRLLSLFEIQRNAMLMYTSCGWFFDNLSGIETTQVLRYAARAMQLARDVAGIDLEPEFEDRLAEAPCSRRNCANGKEVYQKMVIPSRVELHRVAAHVAINLLFGDYIEGDNEIHCYVTNTRDYLQLELGIQKLSIGRTAIRSKILMTDREIDHIVLYFGGHNLTCTVTEKLPDEKYDRAREEITAAFKNGDTAEVIRLMNTHFGEMTYSLWHLFRDALHQILYKLLHTTWEEIDSSFRHIYEENYTVMKLMRNMQMNLPKSLSAPAEFVLSQNLIRTVETDPVDVQRLSAIAEEIEGLGVKVDEPQVRLKCSRRLDAMLLRLQAAPDDLVLLQEAAHTVGVLKIIIPRIGLEEAQNICFDIGRRQYEKMAGAAPDDLQAVQWTHAYEELADLLNLAVPQLQEQA
jgi:alpha-amylase/alpha-mannosidase (GH57 family)